MQCKVLWRLFQISLTLITLSNCQQATEADLRDIYEDAAQRKDINRRAVIVIPGILGSRLINESDDQIVWGAFSHEAANPIYPDAARLIALPMQEGNQLKNLTDSVRPNGALDRFKVSLFPSFTIQPKAYFQILMVLGAGGFYDDSLSDIDYGEEHYTCFQFSYDWRRSNAENAILLGQFIREKKAYIEAENVKNYGRRGDVKFNIVAHSMGSLVARYYLRYGEQGMPSSGRPSLNWAGAKEVDKLVMIAPPTSGSLGALEQLVAGFDLGPFAFSYPPAVLGTMPSIYELLPRARHRVLKDTLNNIDLDPLDPEVWLKNQWGLASLDDDEQLQALLPNTNSPEERSRIARDHLVKCLQNANNFQRALDTPATPPEDLRFILFAGDAVDTPVQAEAWPKKIKLVDYAPGDDTVARYSALGDERFASRSSSEPFTSPVSWSQATFLFETHLGITRSRTFADNILFELLEKN